MKTEERIKGETQMGSDTMSYVSGAGTAAPDVTCPVSLPILVEGREVLFEALAFRCRLTGVEALCLVYRQSVPIPEQVPLVRVHSGCVTGDVLHSLKCDCHDQLQEAIRLIASASYGMLIYLPADEGRGIGLFDKFRAYGLQERGLDSVDANLAIGAPIDARDYRLAAEILVALGVSRLRLLSNNPLKVKALNERRIEVVERIPLVVPSNPHNERYVQTKKVRLNHGN